MRSHAEVLGRRLNVPGGVLHVRQNKTKAKQRMRVQGRLAQVLAHIAARKATYDVHATRFVVDESGQPLGKDALRYRFDKLRRTLDIPFSAFKFRDLRAKAATDKADSTDSGAFTDVEYSGQVDHLFR